MELMAHGRRWSVALVASIIAAMLLIPSAKAAVDGCVATTVVSNVSADAWVDANSTQSNKGSDAVLSVSGTTRSLVRFALPAGVPQGCVVELARLRMYADSGTDGARVEALPLASTWSESVVTWDSQPAATGAPAGAWSRDGYMQWNVTAFVPSMIAGSNHGFLVRDAAEATDAAGKHGFYAREKGENPPQLVIRIAAPPSGDPAPPAPPQPRSVRCGQLVTESTLVTNDLLNCPGDGLVIGADRVILDLGSHTIDGVALGTGVRNEGFGSVTIRNGTIQEFDRGVELLEETRLGVVSDLSIRQNEVAGIELFDAGALLGGNVISGNTVEENGGGILLVSGTRGTVVRGNTLTRNGGAALLLRTADSNRLEGNHIIGGGDLGIELDASGDNVLVGNVVADTSDGAIEIHHGSHGNRVEGSVLTRSGDTGILVSESDGNELVSNTSTGMSDSGIGLDTANDGVVRGNVVRDNPGGLQVDGSSRNLIEANDASGGSGIGIELGVDSFANRLVLNTANGNGAQGIYLSDEAPLASGNELYRNTANDNGADGITVAKGGHTLTANVALRNRGWGISASGVNDAARNMAEGNLQTRQCQGVPCGPLDVTPPETTIDDGPDASTSSDIATFTFSADEPSTTFVCSLDDSEDEPCASPLEYSGLDEGSHELRVTATDELGNTDPTAAVHTWTIDLTAPQTLIESGPDTSTSSTIASLVFSADEAATFECSLDGGAYAPCTSPFVVAGLGLGAHDFAVRATDGAGNTDASPAVHTWSVVAPADVTAPQTLIESGPDTSTTSTSATLVFSADEVATFECSVDGAAYAPCTSPFVVAGLGLGGHEFAVRATDGAGNTDASPAVHTWSVVAPADVTAPQTLIESGPDTSTTS
ncbi:MAG TPA: right-handed parallel beta-helix repeat-containing protein, partial [Ornithinibacter sp.]|nr:right-handed parallel beta-helix repeat-containing protein [Ornithinibacter sp.]